ncbi:LAMI_0G17326g1_1 [Lachancea mirantina]|uniref:Mediator of RNA polymerase II transcription subunit 14 n=1 Tax=Lachancea mirantina TaxID=1230905 RepID=A0A1G4KCU4_9SACH|nr:LAMI_0G17326g1_1 [Lachancea mirantina]
MTTAVQNFNAIDGGQMLENGIKKGAQTNVLVQRKPIEPEAHEEMKAPPEIPHVDFNQLSLALLLRNLTVFAMKEITQFMKTNEGPGQTQESGSPRKASFLQLVVYLRNQFLRIYVLIKWCRTIKCNNFSTMIDLLNWFRGSNMGVNSCIWALKNNLVSMADAKLPNPDLATALEVLTLGRPNLSTYNLRLSGEDERTGSSTSKIPPKLILKKLHDLNTILSIKISLADIPEEFHHYTVKDGRVIIRVENEFELELSTINQSAPFFFVDLRLLFKENLPLNKFRMEKVINEVLFKNSNPLASVYLLLHNYVQTLQIYMIHVELQDLESKGKYSGGNLIHNYDSKTNCITLKYWLQSRLSNKCTALVGVEQASNTIVLKTELLRKTEGSGPMPNCYTNLLGNMENVLNEITFNHSQVIKSDLISTGVFEEDDENVDVFLFQVPTTSVAIAPIQLKINLISGVFYAKNPSPLLLFYMHQINNSSNTQELIYALGRLKLDKISQVLRNMFEKTGWVCNRVIKLSNPISNASLKDQEMVLSQDLFVRLKNWPINWYLIVGVISSNTSCLLEMRIGKIKADKGSWELKYVDQSNVTVSKLEAMSYQKVLQLKKTILQKIVNHMIIDSLNESGTENKIVSGDQLGSLPDFIYSKSSSTNSSLIAIKLTSFLNNRDVENILEDIMMLTLDYDRSVVCMFGKFKGNIKITRYQCKELPVEFNDKSPLSFCLSESYDNLSNIVQCLCKFKQKLTQLLVLTNIIERLHTIFQTETFNITNLRPNEICFKYLEKVEQSYDCAIDIVTNESGVEKLGVRLSPSNFQNIIQTFIDEGRYDYFFIFNYLQFTSSFFEVVGNITSQHSEGNNFETVSLQMHNLSEYELVYHNPETNGKVILIFELRNVLHNGCKQLQYYIHFSEDEKIIATSPIYPLLHEVRNRVFMIDSSMLGEESSANSIGRTTSAIRLNDGVCCDSNEIGALVQQINQILNSG